MLEKLSVITWKMSNTNFCKVIFYRVIIKVFLKVEVRLIDKTQTSDPTKKKFYWMRTLRICVLTALTLKVTVSNLFRLIRTFIIMIGCPNTRVLSSVVAIAFFLSFLQLTPLVQDTSFVLILYFGDVLSVKLRTPVSVSDGAF